jgi:hypothetical protein
LVVKILLTNSLSALARRHLGKALKARTNELGKTLAQ